MVLLLLLVVMVMVMVLVVGSVKASTDPQPGRRARECNVNREARIGVTSPSEPSSAASNALQQNLVE